MDRPLPLHAPRAALIALTALLATSCGDGPTRPTAIEPVSTTVVKAVGDPVDLVVSIVAPPTLKAGNQLVFQVTVTNASPDVIASGVEMSWTGPEGIAAPFSCFSAVCDLGALSPGASVSRHLTITPLETGTLSLTVAVTSDVAEANPANNTATATTEVTAGSDLAIEASGPAQVLVGATFAYDITVRNNGAASGGATVTAVMLPLRSVEVQAATASVGTCAVTVVRVAPATLVDRHKVTCELGPLAAAATATIRIEALYSNQEIEVGPETIVAGVNGADGDVDTANNTASVTSIFAPTDLAVALTGPATALTGESITYVATMTNAGPSSARASLRIALPFEVEVVSTSASVGFCSVGPTGRSVSCSLIDDLPAGQSLTATIQVITTRAAPLLVTAEAQNDSHSESDASNNAAQLSTTVEANPNTPVADLAIAISGPATVKAGDDLSIEVRVTNTSSEFIATSVEVADAGWTGVTRPLSCFGGTCELGPLAAGETRTLVYHGRPNEPGTLTLTATVTSTTSDPNPANNVASLSTEVTPGTDLVITAAGPAQVLLGESFVYEGTVRNDGAAASSAIFTSVMPPVGSVQVQRATATAGSCVITVVRVAPAILVDRHKVTCDLGPMATGASVSIRIEALYPETAFDRRTESTTLKVDADSDVNLANNAATITTIFAPTDLQVSLTGPATGLTGQAITYVATMTNAGPSPARASLSVSFSLGTEIVSRSASIGFCSTGVTGRSVSCGLVDPLEPGQGLTATIQVVRHSASPIQADAEVRNDSGTEMDESNNSAQIRTEVKNPVPVVSLSGNSTVPEGSSQAYTFSVTTASGSFALVDVDCGAAGVLVQGSLSVTATGGSFQCRFADGPASSDLSVTVRDETLNTTGSRNRAVAISNTPPQATLLVSPVSVVEGTPFMISLEAPDDVAEDLPTLQYAFDCGAGYGSFGSSRSVSCPTADDAALVARAQVRDKDGGVTEYTRSVGVTNAAPVIGAITAPVAPTQIGTPITVSGTYSDAGANDTHAAIIDWGDGSHEHIAVNGGAISSDHTYLQPGVFRIRMSITDDDGATSQESVFEFVVAYDPDGGFVTGGGWIWSPPGACELSGGCATAEGKATFGFVAKHKHGVAAGNAEFQFHGGNLRFRSSAYEWLVVAGSKAQFRGTGTVNGAGDYTFVLTAIDGQAVGGGGMDKLRIKITDAASGALVYDNRKGSAEDSSDATVLAGGSIVIHRN